LQENGRTIQGKIGSGWFGNPTLPEQNLIQ
jgi:hypothetical protein